MMHNIWQFLTSRTSLTVIGYVALAALLWISTRLLGLPPAWALGLFVFALLVGAAVWAWRKFRLRRAAQQLGDMLERQASTSSPANSAQRQEQEAIKKRMLDAIATIKGSKLGQASGDAALYELPWYMVIGNPAAGKSTAIASSGLQFPFADTKIVQGVGGTRNCDWFFTTDGILIDTAGRYSVSDEDRTEWFGFLSLLKKYRKKAPINGVIIAVSIAELTANRPEFAINLAKNLRQRVQELTEKLEVHAPVYVVFTKADLITGFNEFFEEADSAERDRVWGATLPYTQSISGSQVLDQFDARFDELYEGLKDMSAANMALASRKRMPPGVFTFPLEFSNIRGPLRSFIATLFEENPFQFKPVFRGFYFTSALQEGEPVSASSKRVAQRFDIKLQNDAHAEVHQQKGYFLLNLFRNVVFADKDLVAQYASPAKTRMRYAAFLAATAFAGLALGGWSWSYTNNRQLVTNVEADLAKAVALQNNRVDLQSRFEALEILQDRIEQLESYRKSRPLALSLGLYQGEYLERKLRNEYFAGVKQVMVDPVTESLEGFLAEVNRNAAELQPASRTPGGAVATQGAAPGATASATAASGRTFKDASPTNSEDAYNALKTYLMLSDPARAEGSHLNDQLTRFWRGWLESNRGAMPKEQMIRGAERIISFYLAQIQDTSWPRAEQKLTLVEQTRDNLRRVVRGMPARERVYAEVKARAATQFPTMTVARIVGEEDKGLVLGSHVVPGTFTREAWEGYVKEAFRNAANGELQSADWVLKTTAKDDLTLEGSPEQIQKGLVEMYKNEYAKEWQKFLQGVTIRDLEGFEAATEAMNRLGDPSLSPIGKLMTTVYDQTSWDNPSLADVGVARAKGGIAAWFRETIMRQKPSQVNVNMPSSTNVQNAKLPLGPVGREFEGVARLIIARDNNASLMRGYMDQLSKVRSRFNTIKNQGDAGPGAKELMQQTLSDTGELASTLKYVDEQMLTGMSGSQKEALRPLLVRPLMQSFAVIVKPTEAEIDKVWTAQVLNPFRQNLMPKYPFTVESGQEASDAEIGQVFGPEGAISKFFATTMGPLVVRRGDEIEKKTWAGIGINLSPQVVAGFPSWVAPLSAGGVANTAVASGGEPQTRFELQALTATGASEFTIEVDGQALRWRGQPQPWVQMVWPNPQGSPGARITALTPQGNPVELLNQPGRNGLKSMVESSQRNRRDNGVFELSWTNGGVVVTANLKIIGTVQAPRPAPSAAPSGQGFKRMRLPETVIAPAAAPAAAAPASTTAAAGAAQ